VNKILIVDDNANNRMTLKLLLEECPECMVEEASNGKEAVQMCIDAAYDLIFMDIMMPVMDGIEATRQIRSFDQSILIVAVSAMGDDYNKELILSAGAKDYMTKPINGDLFLKRLGNYKTLINWRKSRRKFAWPSINLFEQEIYSHASIFYLRCESDISEAWEYLISLDTFGGELASDAIQVYFNIALELLEKKIKSELLLEENEATYILTLLATEAWDEQHIYQMVTEHFVGEYKIAADLFSLLIPKNGTIKPLKSVNIGLDDTTLSILRHSHTDKISASTYIEEMSVEFMDKLDALEMLEESMGSTIFAMQNDIQNTSWSKLGSDLKEYSTIIESLFEFQHISFVILSLAKFIEGLETKDTDPKKRKKLLIILDSILGDLSSWRNSIFIKSNTNDIHYLDSSLLSSCLQAQMIYEESAVVENDDDFELF
jgi:two-component system chemotaxis response regulator CheY